MNTALRTDRKRRREDAPPPPWSTALDASLRRVSGAALIPGNRLKLLRDGRETYIDWLTEMAHARHWVHLENYIFLDDAIGREFAEVLMERARAGVRVRVLYDWFGSHGVSAGFWRRMRRAGVDVRAVNPPSLREPLAIARRDHRKLLTVDGRYGSTGGVCIGEQWLEHSPVTGLPYRDTAVGVTGPAVAEMEQAFAGVWDRCGALLPTDERVAARDIGPTGTQDVRVVVEQPGKTRILRLLDLLAGGVRERLWIADAYFLSLPILHQALMTAARDGVDVRILLPATSDLPLIGPVSRTGYRSLLDAGVRVFEYGGLMMHAKTTVADGWWARVGSANLNISGLWVNWEVDLVAEDRDFAHQMEEMFEEDLSHAREIRLGRSGAAAVPVRRVTRAERRARRKGTREGRRGTAAAARVGRALLGKQSFPLERYERTVTGAVGATLLGTALVAIRFPRLVAWPLAVVGGVVGGAEMLHALTPRRLAPAPAR